MRTTMRTMLLLTMLLLALVGLVQAADHLCLEDSAGGRWTLQASQGVVTGAWLPQETVRIAPEPVPVFGTLLALQDRTVLGLTGIALPKVGEDGFPGGTVGTVGIRLVLQEADAWLDVSTPLESWGASIRTCVVAPDDLGSEVDGQEAAMVWTVRVPESWFELGERERAQGVR